MKTIIITNNQSETNYSLKIIDDEGNVSVMDIDTIVDNGKTLKLPDNPSGRKYWAIKKMEGHDEVELTTKAATGSGATKNTSGKSRSVTLIRVSAKLAGVLTEDELATIKDIAARGEARLNSPEAKQQSELEKRRKKLEQLTKEYEELLAKSKQEGAE